MSIPGPIAQNLASYPPAEFDLPAITHRSGRYRLRIAKSLSELRSIQELRFQVFNLELGEGLSSSFALKRDADEFDPYCHHLMVEDARRNEVVGTYRLMTAEMASEPGFYSANEFDLDSLPNVIMTEAVELGRACVASEHRNSRVLFLLWYGLAQYLRITQRRYFFGCCSLTSQDPALGVAAAAHIQQQGFAHPTLMVRAQTAFRCCSAGAHSDVGPVRLPQLMRMYIEYGARIISEPALDREFGTIDYLALFDVSSLDARARRMFGLEA